MAAKKSKYRHAVINKMKYYFYSIRWLDITGDAGHATPEEFDKFGCAVMVTQAYVYKKTNELTAIDAGPQKTSSKKEKGDHNSCLCVLRPWG